MSVSLTPLVTVAGDVKAWTCRSGPNHSRYGDPYTTGCVISRQPGDMARIEMLTGPEMTKGEMDELKILLRRQGFVSIEWSRIRKDGSVHHAIISLAR